MPDAPRLRLPMLFFETFVLFLFMCSFGLAVFLVGPPFEQRFFPVLDAKFVRIGEVGGRLRFEIEGTKLRGCQVVEASFAWKFDHTVMPAAVSDENGQPRPAAPIIKAGENFVAGPFFAIIPASARLAANLQLTRTYYYRCHFMWTTEFDLESVAILELPPVIPQTPTVTIVR